MKRHVPLLFVFAVLASAGFVNAGIVSASCFPGGGSCPAYDGPNYDSGFGSYAEADAYGTCAPTDYYDNVWAESYASTTSCNGAYSIASADADANGVFTHAAVWGAGSILCLQVYNSSNCDGSGVSQGGAACPC